MPYLGTFGLEFKKTIVISEITSLEFIKNDSLTHTEYVCIGFAFSKGQGSVFFGVNGPCPGPLYKVCPL